MFPYNNASTPATLGQSQQWINDHPEIWFGLLEEASDSFKAGVPFNESASTNFGQIPTPHRANLKVMLQEQVEPYVCSDIIERWIKNNVAWENAKREYKALGKANLRQYSRDNATQQNQIIEQLKSACPQVFARNYLEKHLREVAELEITQERLQEHFQTMQQNGGAQWVVSKNKISKLMPLYTHSPQAREPMINSAPFELLTLCNRMNMSAELGLVPNETDPNAQVPVEIPQRHYIDLLDHVKNEIKYLAAIQKKFDAIFTDDSSGPWGIKIVAVDLFKYKIVIPPGQGAEYAKKLYSVYVLLKHLHINSEFFPDKQYIFTEALVQNSDPFLSLNNFNNLRNIAELFEKADDFKGKLEEVFEYFPEGAHAVVQGNKPLNDFYQSSPVAPNEYESKLKISYALAMLMQRDTRGKVVLADSLQISTTSDHLMYFLEKAYRMLNLKTFNKAAVKEFITHTRGPGLEHKSNIDPAQMRDIQLLIGKIKYAMEDLDEEEKQKVFYGPASTPLEQVEQGYERVIKLYAKKLADSVEAACGPYMDQRALQMLNQLRNAQNFAAADSIKTDIYRYVLDKSFQPGNIVWTNLNALDISIVRSKLGTMDQAAEETGGLDAKKRALEIRFENLRRQFEALDFFTRNARGAQANSGFAKSYQKMYEALLNGIRTADVDNQYYGIGRSIEAVDYFERFVYNMKFTDVSPTNKEAILAHFVVQAVDQNGGDINDWLGCNEGMSGKTQQLVVLSSADVGLTGSIQKSKMDLFTRYFGLRNTPQMLTDYEQGYATRESAQFQAGIRGQVSNQVGLGVESGGGSERTNTTVRYSLFIPEAGAFVKCNMTAYETIFLPFLADILHQIGEEERNAGDPVSILKLLNMDEDSINQQYFDTITMVWNFENIRQDLPQIALNALIQKGYLAPKSHSNDEQIYLGFLDTLRQSNPAAFTRETAPMAVASSGETSSVYFPCHSNTVYPLIRPGDNNFVMSPASVASSASASSSSSSRMLMFSGVTRPAGAPEWGQFASRGYTIPTENGVSFTPYESIVIGDKLMPLLLKYNPNNPQHMASECNKTPIELRKLERYLSEHTNYNVTLTRSQHPGNSSRDFISVTCTPKAGNINIMRNNN